MSRSKKTRALALSVKLSAFRDSRLSFSSTLAITVAAALLLSGLGMALPLSAEPASPSARYTPSIPPAPEVDCTVVLDAGEKTLDTPHHLYTTQVDASHSQPTTHEMITINNARYILSGGKWIKSPVSLDAAREQAREDRKNPKMFTCQHLRDEMVGADAAGVYLLRINRDNRISERTLWISKSQNVYLRVEEGGSKGEPLTTGKYEYGNVRVPD
jgi:hypothetical protein